jgi:polyisoprenoid-binding protein YceI
MRTRIVTALVCAFSGLALTAAAQSTAWQIDSNHSAAQFAVRHLGISTVRGTFSKVSGTVNYSATDPGKTQIDVAIDASSVDTRVEKRDNDLRSPHFFDIANFPTISFKSRKVESPGEGKLKVTGDLTIRGTTREVVLDVDGPTSPVKDPAGNLHMGASATTKLNRRDFGVSGAGSVVADDIAITLDVELIQRVSAPATPPASR